MAYFQVMLLNIEIFPFRRQPNTLLSRKNKRKKRKRKSKKRKIRKKRKIWKKR
jgi:hypothetical protein